MSRKSALSLYISIAASFLTLVWVLPSALAQHGSEGTVAVSVLDPSGSVVPGARLELRDLGTNIARTADTRTGGTYTFVNLPLGTYRLTVSKQGFKAQVFDTVIVQATKTTDISATLTVGALAETVEVTAAAAPLVETTSNEIGSVIDMKQIEDLPVQGRDLTTLTQLVPGYTGSLADGGGTFNGLPGVAQGSNIDGVIGNAGRMKFDGGAVEPAAQPRIENIQEMTVQTDQLDLNQGYGNSSMQVNFITRSGTNNIHGRVYEDFRNDWLNANSWSNDFLNAQNPRLPGNKVPFPKNKVILNEFGGSVGGPIIKNKLFAFGTFAMRRQPGVTNAYAWLLTPAAQAGNFIMGNGNTVNVYNLISNCGAGCGSAPTTPNGQTSSILSAVNGVKPDGVLSSLSDPNFQQLNWQISNPDKEYYPTVRVDYNPNQKARFNVAWNYTKIIQPGATAPNLPGSAFAKTGAGNQFKDYTAALGFNYTISPSIVNELRGGFLYVGNFFAYNGIKPTTTTEQIQWNFADLPFPQNTNMNGTNFPIPTGSYYPVFNASDTVSWQKHAHTMNFGFSWWREQDHYYNGVLGWPAISLGLTATDPASNAFSGSSMPGASTADISGAQELYAVLVGRINAVTGNYTYNQKTNSYGEGQIGAYNLDEVQKSYGLFFQDSYRFRPNLTLNYGLRWDAIYPDQDVTNAYHSALDPAIWGPSGIGNIFNPGSLKGTDNPMITQSSAPAKRQSVPQPAFGFAWSPGNSGKTVLRAGFSLRMFTEPQQYFWNEASDFGAFYFQGFSFNPLKTSGTQPTGTFAPGNFSLGSQDGELVLNGATQQLSSFTCPASGVTSATLYACNPATYQVNEPESDFTYVANAPGVNGVSTKFKQPYTESWNVGIQRQIGNSRALEVRYIGNRSLRQWININPNEVNIFENKFLQEFKNAQTNLALNGGNSFADSTNGGAAGTIPLPIMDAAFSADTSQFTNSTFTNQLQTGKAGAFANALATTPQWFCDMVGSAAFSPCLNNASINVAGAGYPINFFQANPYVGGGITQLVSEGYSNYNAMQVDFRQRAWHGLQFDANYTWSHTLGISTPNNWLGQTNILTLRNERLAYGPMLFDIRHAIHISGTYDLPFGKGKTFLTNPALDRVVGGWTLGSIFTLQTGNPFQLQGGFNNTSSADYTFNDYGDGGVNLHGVTVSQLQSSVGVYPTPAPPGPGNQPPPSVDFINPKYLANNGSGGGANSAFITPNTTPGTLDRPIYLYGPRFVNDDLSLTKRIPITERVNFSLQMEALNAFNHPSFQPGSGHGCTFACGAGGGFPVVNQPGFGIGGLSPTYAPRVVELRANIEF
jgi:hypothetical protein